MTYFMMSGTFDDEYDVKTKTRMANVGTDLPTLLAWLDSDDFSQSTHKNFRIPEK